MVSDVSAIILAGGKSTRLGRDKASEQLLGVSLLQRVVSSVERLAGEIIVVSAAGQKLPALKVSLPIRTIEDVHAEFGPLGGIYSGLRAVTAPYALTVACDMPLLQPTLLSGLLRLATDDYDAVIPTNELALPEPLCAVYNRRCLAAIESQLSAGALKVALFLDKVRVRYVAPPQWRAWDPDGVSFLNVNREKDLKGAETVLKKAEAR
jgi:molybdopterin-guanine dinucleotide biosynthesis protein A